MFSGNLHWKNYVQADTAKKLKIVMTMVISHCIIISGESQIKNDFCACLSHKLLYKMGQYVIHAK